MNKESIILYSISLILDNDINKDDTRKEQLASALGISPRTLDLYLGKLSGKGYLERKKKWYIKDLRSTITITIDGRKELNNTENEISTLMLTENRHNVPYCMNLKNVKNTMREPLDRIFFLALFNHNKFFDLPLFLQTIKISKEDTHPLNILETLVPGSGRIKRKSFVESFHNASLFGILDMKLFSTDEWRREDIDALIILAEAKIRGGKLEDARMIHDHLLNLERSLSQNQWFIIKIGQVMSLKKSGAKEEAIELLDQLERMVDNRVYSAHIRARKAMILFFSGKREEGRTLLDSAIKSFSAFGLPIFLAMAHNNRGVIRFIQEDMDGAEQDWIKTRRYAREAKSTYAEAIVLPNLADIAIKSGEFGLARTHLEKAMAIFESLHDQEGMAIIEFNHALMKVEMGDIQNALDRFRKWESMFQILILPEEKKIMRKNFIKRSRERGFMDIEKRLQDLEKSSL